MISANFIDFLAYLCYYYVMGKFANRISGQAVLNTMKSISKGAFSDTKKALEVEGFKLSKNKSYSRDEVRQGFKIARKLDTTIKTGWQAGSMANKAFAAHDQLAAERKQEQRSASQRLIDLQNRVFRKKVGDEQALQGSQSRVTRSKIENERNTGGARVATATPTLHAVPTGGNAVLKQTTGAESLRPDMVLADPADHQPPQIDELTNAGSKAPEDKPTISDEEFKKLQDKAKEVSGTQMLS